MVTAVFRNVAIALVVLSIFPSVRLRADSPAAPAPAPSAVAPPPQPVAPPAVAPQPAAPIDPHVAAHDKFVADAQKALEDGLRGKAVRLFSQALTEVPTDTATALQAAQLAYDIENYLVAADLAAVGLDGASDANQRAQARALLDKWQPDYKSAAGKRFDKAMELVSQGKFVEALPDLRKAMALSNKPQEKQIALWLVCYCAGLHDESLDHLRAWFKLPSARFSDIASLSGASALQACYEEVSKDPVHSNLLDDAFGERAHTSPWPNPAPTPAPATPTPATPAPATPTPATPAPATPTPATPAPATPTPATPAPATPTPTPATPAPATPAAVPSPQ
ncbi:MAG: hypothetical protein P4L33_05795 [Capsulimonadaceae bacterium]|nr:hypothetical protein [Capsulimonadaceae bacterium]